MTWKVVPLGASVPEMVSPARSKVSVVAVLAVIV
jgi:hypothetical protein